MKKGLVRKMVYLGLALCVIASMLAFACAEPTPEKPTTEKPTTEKPTTEKPTTEKPTTEKPTTEKPTTEKPTTPTEETPQYGGTLKILALGLPSENLGYPATSIPRWNPTLPQSCVETLLRVDNTGSLSPRLATGWEWSDDHMSLTITLRQGVKFHDGTDFDAEAVKYLLNLVVESSRTELKTVSSIDIIDDYTVRITMSAYDTLLLDDMASTAGAMVSPTAIETYGWEHNVDHPVSTGPFQFVSFERDVSCKFERFDDYWIEGQPYLDKLEYYLLADSVTAKAAFLAGEGQIIGTLNPLDTEEVKTKSELSWNIGPLVAFCPDGSNPDSPFADVRVRQAVSYAIDVETIVDVIGYGYFIATNQASAPGLWSYNADVIGYPYDPQKAKGLLIEAGYPNGFDTTIYYESPYSDIANACLAAQQYLADVGINAVVESSTMGKMTQVMTSGWENGLVASRITMGVSYPPLKTLKKNLSPNATRYVSVLHPEAINTVLEQAYAEPDPDKLAKLVQEIQRMMIDDYCTINPLYSRTGIWARYPEVQKAGWLCGPDLTENPGGTWLSK